MLRLLVCQTGKRIVDKSWRKHGEHFWRHAMYWLRGIHGWPGGRVVLAWSFDASYPGGTQAGDVGGKKWFAREDCVIPCREFPAEGNLGGMETNAVDPAHATAHPDH